MTIRDSNSSSSDPLLVSRRTLDDQIRAWRHEAGQHEAMEPFIELASARTWAKAQVWTLRACADELEERAKAAAVRPDPAALIAAVKAWRGCHDPTNVAAVMNAAEVYVTHRDGK